MLSCKVEVEEANAGHWPVTFGCCTHQSALTVLDQLTNQRPESMLPPVLLQTTPRFVLHLDTLARSSCLTLLLTFSARLQVNVIIPANCLASPSISCKLGLEAQSKVSEQNSQGKKCYQQGHYSRTVHSWQLWGIAHTNTYRLLTPYDEGQPSCSQLCLVVPIASPTLPPLISV